MTANDARNCRSWPGLRTACNCGSLGGVVMTAHCHCRPGCLSPVRSTDTTVATPAGLALAVHLHPTVYAVADLTSLVSPLSVVGAK